MTPSFSPGDPIMTRTSRARIRPFTRICGCRFELAPGRRSGSAPRRRISIYRNSQRHPRQTPGHSNLATAAIHRDEELALYREPKGSCRKQSCAGKANLVTITFRSFKRLFCRRVAKMRLVRCVRSSVVEHRIKRGRQGLELYNTGKHRAIANFGIDDECRSLGDLERMKFCRRCANALFDLGRTRALEELFLVNLGSARSNLGGDFLYL